MVRIALKPCWFKSIKTKLKHFAFTTFGIIDASSRSLLFKTQESVIVLHEVSDNPCLISIRNKTNTSIRIMMKLMSEYEKGWMIRLNVKLTFDDGFTIQPDILEKVSKLKIPTIFFVNALTVETGLDYQILEQDSTNNLMKVKEPPASAHEARKIFNSIKLNEVSRNLEALQGARFDWKDILDLNRKGFSIGDHFLYHISLPRLTLTSITSHLDESRKCFDQHGVEIRFFALPFGQGGQREVALLANTGFERVYGGSAWSVLSGKTTCVPRVQVSEENSRILTIRGELLLNRIVQKLTKKRI